MAESIKIVIVGDAGIGKSCLLLRFTEDKYTESFIVTVSSESNARSVDLHNNGKPTKIEVWDTVGHERYLTLTSTFFRNAGGVMVAFDVTDRRTFENVDKWLANVDRYVVGNVVKVLVGNKADLVDERVIGEEQAKAKAAQHNLAYFETSAKTGEGVDKAFLELARMCTPRDNMDPTEIVTITPPPSRCCFF